ncbi:MAG: penicillin-binding protein 2 [Candidatus Woesebacteria bacterium]|nr:penicillin-binding protein 2 [Candidatus Woesebacteria bacterium]
MRLKIAAFVFFLLFVSVSVRLFYWQIVKGKELSQEASLQYSGSKKIEASRGNIYANDGTWLAVTRTNWLLFAELPKLSKPTSEIANLIAPLLVPQEDVLIEIDRIEKVLNRDGVVWVPIRHKITADIKEKIENLKIAGLGFETEENRYYPEGSSSAQLLGFVGKNDEGNDTGYFGLEGFYDILLSGKSGYIQREKDLRGVPLLSGGVSEMTSLAGTDLITFIDKRIQNSIEEKLKEGIEKYGAKEGSVVVMDPFTGKILGMSSYPSYDPAKYNEFDSSLYRNPAISDIFEPGSVFKIIIMAAALDAKVVKPDTICDICTGPLKVDKYFIETWDKKYYPDSTMRDVIVHSDNVGMSFVAQKLGDNLLYDYLDKFGIGKATNIDLQGESNISLRKKGTWNIVDLVTASFGQGIATTPIQIIRAASVIANGGYLITPKVVENNNSFTKEKIISEDASQKMTAIMVDAASYGESKWTNLKGFSVAGKTGTAQIPISGHYDAEKTIASFVGFAPANNPKFIMLVTLKEPQSSQWASETAAPLWYSIAKDLFNYFGIQPEN